MGIKVYKPISNARRQMSIVDYSDLTKKAPEKSLIWIKKKNSGRNSSGKITCRHKGGGTRRFYRIVDFKRDKFDIPATVAALEYDPNRTSRIALLHYRDGEKRYIVAPVDLKVGDKIISSRSKVEIMPGNCSTLENIPVGVLVHNVELIPGKGGEIARAAGSWVKLMAIEGDFALLKLPSSEVRKVPKTNLATIGQVSNAEHMHVDIGKAGRKRHMGIKPTVRGKVMNPNDHPHGGGEARNSIGLKRPKTPWGKIALGGKTRKANKISNLLIISRRKKNK